MLIRAMFGGLFRASRTQCCKSRFDVIALLLLAQSHRASARSGIARQHLLLFVALGVTNDVGRQSLDKIKSFSHKAQARSIAVLTSSRTFPGIVVVTQNVDRFRVDLFRLADRRARLVYCRK